MLGSNALRQIAIDQDFKVFRHTDQIVVYKAWHENGFVQLYINRSANLVYQEIVLFELQNLQIDGLEGEKQVFVNIGPGEEQMVKLSIIDDDQERKLSSKVSQSKTMEAGSTSRRSKN